MQQLHQVRGERCAEPTQLGEQRRRKELGSSDGFKYDLVNLIALHEPLGAPQCVLAELPEALARLRPGSRVIEMDPYCL